MNFVCRGLHRGIITQVDSGGGKVSQRGIIVRQKKPGLAAGLKLKTQGKKPQAIHMTYDHNAFLPLLNLHFAIQNLTV